MESPEKRNEKLAASIELLKKKIRGIDRDREPERLRGLKKKLRRLQRKQVRSITRTLEETLQNLEARREMIARLQDALRQKGKGAGDPHMHSLSKKLKTVNRQLRRYKRLQEKAKRAQAKAAAAGKAAGTPGSQE